MKPIYPNAALFAIGSMTAAAAEQLCRAHSLELTRTERGNFALTVPAAPQVPGLTGAGLHPDSLPADAAGPQEAA